MRTLFMLTVILLTAMISCYTSIAQEYFYNDKYYASTWTIEAGLTTGLMNCLTDIGGRSGDGKKFLKDVNWQNSRFCSGVFISANYDYKFALRLELNMGKVAASDQILKDEKSSAHNRYLRNLHFRSNITELLLLTELHPFYLCWNESNHRCSPYMLGGVGILHFNPQAKWNDQWINLQSLQTEGQGFVDGRERYNLTQINYPFGAGARYEASALLQIRFEFVYRFLKTDYLDDVSTTYIDPSLFEKFLLRDQAILAKQLADRQSDLDPAHKTKPGSIRGNPSNNDGYFSFNLKIGFIINRERRR